MALWRISADAAPVEVIVSPLFTNYLEKPYGVTDAARLLLGEGFSPRAMPRDGFRTAIPRHTAKVFQETRDDKCKGSRVVVLLDAKGEVFRHWFVNERLNEISLETAARKICETALLKLHWRPATVIRAGNTQSVFYLRLL
jgi:hypothetical protein